MRNHFAYTAQMGINRLIVPIVIFAGSLASACAPAPGSNAALEADAGTIVKAMYGIIQYRGTTDKECPGPDDGKHWGSTYGTLVCVSGGLNQANNHRGSVALHEAGHAWFARMFEWYDQSGDLSFPGWGLLGNEENASDCFGQARGGSHEFNSYVGGACSAAQMNQIRGWMNYFPPTSSAWVP